MPLPARERPGPESVTTRSGLGVVRVVWRQPQLRAVTAATGLGAVSFGALPVIAVLLAAKLPSGSAGWLLSAVAAGGLIGSLAYARFPVGSRWPQYVVMVGLLAEAVPLALVPLAPGLGTMLVLFGLSGFFTSPQTAALFATRDRHSPPTMHTQVFTFGAGLKVSLAALGAAAAGVAAAVGAGGLLLGVATCLAGSAVLGTALLRVAAPTDRPPATARSTEPDAAAVDG